jgi:hypothetical protein
MMCGYIIKNLSQCSYSQRAVIRDCKVMNAILEGSQLNMASGLSRDLILKLAKRIDEFST